MAQSPELLMRIAELRNKARSGTMTLEEAREGVALLREDRVGASAASAGARKAKASKAAGNAINSDDLLRELEGGMGL